MRVVIQRVIKASVEINGEIYASIENGLLIFLGIEDTDTTDDIEWLSGKIIRLRLFNDENGVMNHSIIENKGALMIVSQFTLHASTKKGNRPSYIRASQPAEAIPKYEEFIRRIREESRLEVKTGLFGADMKINLVNDGPVTIMIDTKNKEQMTIKEIQPAVDHWMKQY